MSFLNFESAESDKVKVLEPMVYIGECDTDRGALYLDCIMHFSRYFGISAEKEALIRRLIGTLLNTVKLTDDIDTSGTYSDGSPVAQHIFGLPQTLNVVVYYHVQLITELLDNFQPHGIALVAAYFDSMVTLHEAVYREISWNELNQCPNEAEYLTMIQQKVGAIGKFAVKIMQTIGNCVSFGVEEKVLDDLVVWCQVKKDYEQMRQFCNALSHEPLSIRSPFTFPLVHAIAIDSEDCTFLKYLKSSRPSGTLKRLVRERLEKTGSMEYTKQWLHSMAGQLARALPQFMDGAFRLQEVELEF